MPMDVDKMMNRREFLERLGLLGAVAATEPIWKRKFFPGWTPPPTRSFHAIEAVYAFDPAFPVHEFELGAYYTIEETDPITGLVIVVRDMQLVETTRDVTHVPSSRRVACHTGRVRVGHSMTTLKFRGTDDARTREYQAQRGSRRGGLGAPADLHGGRVQSLDDERLAVTNRWTETADGTTRRAVVPGH
jgi:hypothetical protein